MASIAIMQPYIFPYIGYFQLVNEVDRFIFYNDVNFIKKGWIHRNRLLLNGSDFLFTIPCAEVSQNKRICDIKVAFDQKEKSKLLATIRQAYKGAPFFEEIYPLVEGIILKEVAFIDELAVHSVKEISNFLGLSTAFGTSKDQYGDDNLKREERLIDICLKEGIHSYINPIGGQEIYTKEYFRERGIDLKFLKPVAVTYKQFENDFVPWLSIIDVLMFNDRGEILKFLKNFELV